MENKKTIVGIVIVLLLIIALIVASYSNGRFNSEQVKILTEESNKILQLDFATESIDMDIKTEKTYATVEKAMKEYVVKLKNIYLEIEEMKNGINPNIIFSAQNVQDKNLEEIDNIINDYKEKAKEAISEYEELITEGNIKENITSRNIASIRKDYYINLYNTVMLGDVMKEQYSILEEKIQNEKGNLYEKLNKIEKIKTFLNDNEKYWSIKDDKIQFSNVTRMTEYYGLVNQLID